MNLDIPVVKETAGMERRKIEIAAVAGGLGHGNMRMTMTRKRKKKQRRRTTGRGKALGRKPECRTLVTPMRKERVGGKDRVM